MKIWLYGKPFSGKTTFVSDIPNSLILSTDGNATGLFPEDRIVPIKNTDDISNFINDFQNGKYKDVDYLIIDVVEHVYDMIREYTLEKNKLEHESDGSWGKGWQLVESAEWYTLSKLSRLAKNTIFISHEDEYTTKSAIGKETTCYRPALNSKLHDKMTGLMTIVCRAVLNETSVNNEIVKKYYISFGNTSNELSGTRIKLKSTKIENSWKEFQDNLITK